eukprot:6687667-Prorocentrum_lima.AAC.1
MSLQPPSTWPRILRSRLRALRATSLQRSPDASRQPSPLLASCFRWLSKSLGSPHRALLTWVASAAF